MFLRARGDRARECGRDTNGKSLCFPPSGHPQFRSNPLRLILCELKYKIEGLWTEYTAFFVTLIFRSLEPGTASRENLLSFRMTEMSHALRI